MVGPDPKAHQDVLCDICGDVGIPEAIMTCSECKIANEHVYCTRVYQEILPKIWHCEACEQSSKVVSEKLDPDEGLNFALLSDLSGANHQDTSLGAKEFVNGKGQGCNRLKVELDSYGSSGVKKAVSDKGKDWEQIKVEQDTNSSCGGEKLFNDKGKGRHQLKVEQDTNGSSGVKKLVNDKGKGSREMMVDIGKVKYLPTEEAIKLSSGALKFGCPLKNNLHPGVSRTKKSRHMRNPIKPKAPPLNLSLQKEKPNHTGGYSGHVRSPRPYGVQVSLIYQQQKKKIPKEQTGDNIFRNAEPNKSDIEDSAYNVVHEAEKLFPRVPSIDPCWKGCFKVAGTLQPIERNGGFQAHPPSMVRRKVYELSKQMPEVLDFELLPRNNLWVDIFPANCPDKDDIGLFFFPLNNERSEGYTSLLELMQSWDLVMRHYVDSVELLVLPSILLHVDSQKWKGKYYLWGVFRRINLCNVLHRSNEKCIMIVNPSEPANENHVDGNEVEVIDMEIDMEGGTVVGRVDRVRPKLPCYGAEALTSGEMHPC